MDLIARLMALADAYANAKEAGGTMAAQSHRHRLKAELGAAVAPTAAPAEKAAVPDPYHLADLLRDSPGMPEILNNLSMRQSAAILVAAGRIWTAAQEAAPPAPMMSADGGKPQL